MELVIVYTVSGFDSRIRIRYSYDTCPLGRGSSSSFCVVSNRLSIGVSLGDPPKVHISADDRKVIGYMLSDNVASSTVADYAGKGLPFWKKFLHASRRWPLVWLQDDSIVGLQAPEKTDVTRTHLFILYGL